MHNSPAKKAAFLERITQRLGRPRPEKVESPSWSDLPAIRGGAVLERFTENVMRAGAEVVAVSPEGLSQRIKDDIQRDAVKRMVAWQDSVPLLEGAPLEALHIWQSTQPDSSIRDAEQADVGLVRAEWGIAFSGTVMLWNGPERGRSVSLLPAALWVILPASCILPRLEPALAWIRKQGAPPSCINFISGPSRTSDIENDLSIGVHGPGELRIYLVDTLAQD